MKKELNPEEHQKLSMTACYVQPLVKICTKCGDEKSIDNYRLVCDRVRKDGSKALRINRICNTCVKINQRKYKTNNNKEHRYNKTKEWKNNNKEGEWCELFA